MDLEEKLLQINNQTSCPVFSVKTGVVKKANIVALKCGIKIGQSVQDIIYSGFRDYKKFSQGTLYLAVRINDKIYNATVVRYGTTNTFILDSEFISTFYKQLNILSDKLREPLSDAMFALDGLYKQQNFSNNIYMMQLKRSLMRLHRSFYNMGSLPDNTMEPQSKKSNQDLTMLIEEIAQDTQTVMASAGYKLKYTIPKRKIICYMDLEMMRRAVMNMLANAMRFTRPKKTIHLKMTKISDNCKISVTNFFEDPALIDQFDQFSIYSHASLDKNSGGIGLGLNIIRSVATAHGGALLMDRLDENTIQLTMSLPVMVHAENRYRNFLRTYRKHPTSYTGGYNFILTELSDILPPESFK